MKCDLHVHTSHSGMCGLPLLGRFCRECYSDPLEVYRTLKQRGMSLVTVTDHDSIDAAEPLRRFPDFFLSEEVTCVTPSGTAVHVGVYDIHERQHVELQRRRNDLPALAAYLAEQHLLFSINHLFSALTGRRTDSDFQWMERRCPAVETLNGHMLACANTAAAAFAARTGKAAVAGSDAHTLAALGRTYTQVRGARGKQEFLASLRCGRGAVAGESGSYWKLTAAVLDIGASLFAERPLARALYPLAPAVPFLTLANMLREISFVRKWQRRLAGPSSAPRPGWPRDGAMAEAAS